MVSLLNSKRYISDRLLTIKSPTTFKNYPGYYIVRDIDLLGAPIEFIKENNLPIYHKPSKKKKK